MIYCYENKIKTLKELAIEFNCSIDTIRRKIKIGVDKMIFTGQDKDKDLTTYIQCDCRYSWN